MLKLAAPNSSSHVATLFQAVMYRLSATDIDQEIKEAAIEAIGDLIALAGDRIVDYSSSFSVLYDRLKNEITRNATLKVPSLFLFIPSFSFFLNFISRIVFSS